MREKISVSEFENRLKSEINTICSNYKLSLDAEKERGEAFSIWTANLIIKNHNLEEDSYELMGGSSDLKCDVIIEDEIEKKFFILQTKYVGMGKKRSARGQINVDDLKGFSNRHFDFQDPSFIRNHGNEKVQAKLLDYRDLVKEGYKFYYYYVVTANSTETTQEIIEKKQKEFENLKEEVVLEILDFDRLKENYLLSLSSEQSIPDEVHFDVPEGKFIIKKNPRTTMLGIIKGSSLINLYKKHKKSLFTWNIRSHLGDKGINKNIKKTALEEPEDFYYFNNGISAVCTDLTWEDNQFNAKKLQIINGAQTLVSLYLARDKAKDVEILFKVTVSGSTSTEKGFNANIIKYNNTQNKVNLSDFRSNDSIQDDIQKLFSINKVTSVNNINYIKKRGEKRVVGLLNLYLESLARIRYSYLYNPCDVISNAKDLWDTEGKYADAFGIDGKIPDIMPEEKFKESFIIPVCLFSEIEDQIKLKSKNDDYKDLKRFKYHFLALSKLLVDKLTFENKDALSISKLLKEKDYLKKFVEKFISLAFNLFNDLIIDVYETIKEGKKMSINAPLRDLQINKNKWESVKLKFKGRMDALSQADIKKFMND